MSRKTLWILTGVLLLGVILINFVYVPSRKTELQKNGRQAYGTIVNKDSRPIGDGTMAYFVTLQFQDDQKKNFRVDQLQMLDEGRWNSLKVNQDIKDVYYIPGQESMASIPGGARMVAPHSGALSYISWSMFIAAIVTGYMAFNAAEAAEKQKKPTNKVTVTRH
jgi:hypothetical protein